MKGLIIIPAYNEEKAIGAVLRELPKNVNGQKLDAVVIDDYSNDQTARIAQNFSVIVLRHLLNRGAGAAIKTGLEYAKAKNYDFAVTFDADGQHNPKDLEKLIKPIIDGMADVVIGSRFKSQDKIPWDRYLINSLANVFTLLLYGTYSSDTQSGLRAFSKKAIRLINFKGERHDYSSEIFLEAKKNDLNVVEVPTSVIYTEYSRAKGQQNTNTLLMAAKLLLKIIQ